MKRKRDALIVGVFALVIVIAATITNIPACLRLGTLQCSDCATIESNGDELHYHMERYACPKLECFPTGCKHAFPHTHFDVVLRHLDRDGAFLGGVKRSYVYIKGQGLELGEELSPSDLVILADEAYTGQPQVRDPDLSINNEAVVSLGPLEWGRYILIRPHVEPSCDPMDDPAFTYPGVYNPGLGRTE